MSEQIPEFLKGFLLGLPIWGIAGWFLSRIFSPLADELGNHIKKWTLGRFNRDEYSTYVTYTKLEHALANLHKEQGYSRFEFKNNHSVNLIIKKFNPKQLRDVAKTWIQHGHIWSYAESDIFFAGMEILIPYMTKEDIDTIVIKHRENNQANVWPFLEIVEQAQPGLLSANSLNYLREEQRKYEAKLERHLQKKS
jgi:hypothetical protein